MPTQYIPIQCLTLSGKVSTSASLGLGRQALPAEINTVKTRLGLLMLCPHHRTLRRTWLQAVLATGPEKKGELSLHWKLGSFRAPEGHNWGEGKSRAWPIPGEGRRGLGVWQESNHTEAFPGHGEKPCSGNPFHAEGVLPGDGEAGGLRGPAQRKSCLALEECHCSSHPHIDLPPSASTSLLCHFFQRRQEPDQPPRPEPQELGPLNGDTGE